MQEGGEFRRVVDYAGTLPDVDEDRTGDQLLLASGDDGLRSGALRRHCRLDEMKPPPMAGADRRRGRAFHGQDNSR